ncbi:MAG: SRPBCC domain-containing protein [Deltaproteobacteria bacterium]|nr:SRPBCC domain-containing protein [Deltaproteobacteria bacterium]
MATEALEMDVLVAATAEDLYKAWLDGELHSQFTGAAATGSPDVGTMYTAWDGYISGRNLELDNGRRIVQSWRTTDFGTGDPDSRLEVILQDVDGGTRLLLVHTEIPEGQGLSYRDGWKRYYFEPLQAFFGEIRRAPAKAKAPAKKPVAAREKAAAPKKAPAKKKAAPKKKAPAKKKVAPKKKAPAKKVTKKKAAKRKAAPRKAKRAGRKGHR